MPAKADLLYYVVTDSKSVTTNNVDKEGSVEMVYNTTNGSTTTTTNIGSVTLTNSGSPDTLGLTSSFDQTSASVGTMASASYAAADLSTGLLKASVSNSGNGPNASSQAQFFDTLTFSIPGATSSTVTDLGVHYVVHGLFDNVGSVDLPLLFGSGLVDPQWIGVQAPSYHFNAGWVSETVNQLDTQDFDFTGFIAVTGASPVVDINASINLTCAGVVTCSTDFSHTGTVGLVLPTGVTYTSASTVFLADAQQAAVPEPSSFVLLGLSLAGIGFIRRKRRSS